MATDAGELIVKISADVTDIKNQLNQMANNVQGLGVKTIAAGNLMADAFKRLGDVTIQFVKSSILAFAEHEQAVTRLSIAVGKNAAQSLAEYAQELQKTTAFSDDAILSLENQLAQYGIYPGSVREATAALLKFAAATGVDLPSAGAMLAKAMAGQSRELKNYGIDVSVAGTRSENLQKVITGLNSKFVNAAEIMRGTTLGAMESLSNRFDDLKKRIGEDLLPVTNKFIGFLETMVKTAENVRRSTVGYSNSLEDQKAKLTDLIEKARQYVELHRIVPQELQNEIKAQVAFVNHMRESTKAHDENKGATDREIASIRSLKDEIMRLQQEQKHLAEITQLNTQKRILGAQMEVEQMRADQKKITEITKIETDKRMEAAQVSWEANASFSDQLKVKMSDDLSQTTTAWVNLASQMLDSFTAATARMIVEGGRFRDVMKNMWQQLAEMVIQQILRMMAEWLVFQAMTGGAGGAFHGFMAEGGMINEPSVIMGLKSGKKHIAGEAGPEMVVPAHGGGNVAFEKGGGHASAMGGGGGGGGDIHVHISGQFVEGNPSKWQRLIQEQIAPEIRRLAMKDPNSLITRKRGALS